MIQQVGKLLVSLNPNLGLSEQFSPVVVRAGNLDCNSVLSWFQGVIGSCSLQERVNSFPRP
jgi:hypothetical protein